MREGDNALSQLVPLALLLIGIPSIAGVVLVYCQLFERMPRLFKGLALTIAVFIALYIALLLLNIPVPEDAAFKAVFSFVWVAVYYAFAQTEFVDWQAAELGPRCVAGSYALMFVLDQVSPGDHRLHPRLLLAFAIACKFVFAAGANALDSGCSFQPEHLIPLRVARQETDAAAMNDGGSGGNAVAAAPMVEAYAADMGATEVMMPESPERHYSRVTDEGVSGSNSLRLPSLELPAWPQITSSAMRVVAALPGGGSRDADGAAEHMIPTLAAGELEAAP